MALEAEARRQGTSVSRVLDHIAKFWLKEHARGRSDDAEQARFQAAIAKYAGTLSAGPDFSHDVSSKMRALMKERHGRKRSA